MCGFSISEYAIIVYDLFYFCLTKSWTNTLREKLLRKKK